MYAPIRDGNRGGRGLFSWEDVRVMSYKDRECYLGSTVNLGFLDKGGRWRKRDWWTKTPETNQNAETLEEERRRVIEEENRHLEEALGLKPVEKQAPTGLTESELREITQKGKEKQYDPEAAGLKVTGLGFTKPADEPKPKEKHHHHEPRKTKSHKKHREKHYH